MAMSERVSRIVSELDHKLAEEFVKKKPVWKGSDQDLNKAATLISAGKNAVPGDMLEIGSSAGEGAAALLFGSNDRTDKLYGIDVVDKVYYDKTKEIGAMVYEAFPDLAPRYKVVTGITSTPVRNWDQRFTLVHIDAHHSHPWALFDLLNVIPRLEDGAIILFDDANYLAPLSQAAYFLARSFPEGFGLFSHSHYIIEYKKKDAALAAGILRAARMPWQTFVFKEMFAGLFEDLDGHFETPQLAEIMSALYSAFAEYERNRSIFDPMNQRLWQSEQQRRQLFLAQQK